MNVNVNNTPMTIDLVCKTFCLWTCNFDLLLRRGFLYIVKIAVHCPCEITIAVLIIAVLENFPEKCSLFSTNGFKDVFRNVYQISKSGFNNEGF